MTKKIATEKIRHRDTPIWEWIIAAVGLVLVLIALGASIHRAVTEVSEAPNLNISVVPAVPATDGYLVTFQVKNTSSQTAAGLTVEGKLFRGDEDVETSTAVMTYSPANSTRQGGLFFTKNPNEFRLQIRALGYEKP